MGGEGHYKAYPNVPALFGVLISQGVATLHELKTVYTYEDAIYMYEAIMVPKYNEWLTMERNKAKKNG